jgi:pimeloyl-ACP methyl ester carboxylesterase
MQSVYSVFHFVINNPGTIIFYLILIYVLISILVFLSQDYFLFKPEKLSPEFQFQYDNLDFDEHVLDIKPGVTLSVLHFKAKNPRGIVLYLKGNSRSIKGWGKFAIDFIRYNHDVIMVDYRGFGKSTGRRSQQGIKDDLQLVYDKIKEQVDERFIVIYGRSFGSGFATKLASTNNPNMLVLDAPYYSMAKTTGRYLPFLPMSWLLKFPIPTYKWIKYVKRPIHIIHGTNDNLIPFKSSINLAEINPTNTELHPVIGGGHNNLHTFESYHEILSQIFAKDHSEFEPNQSSMVFEFKKKKQTRFS